MSANGVFSSTLEYGFIGGGNVVIAANTYVFTSYTLDSQVEVLTVDQPDGVLASTLEYEFSSLGNVLISGEASSDFNISLSSTLQALTVDNPSGELNKTIPFSLTSTGKVDVNGIGVPIFTLGLNSQGKVDIVGTISGSLPGPTLASTGGLKSIIGEASLFLDFYSSSQADIKPTIFATSENSIIFTLQSEALLPVKASLDYELSFDLEGTIRQITYGTASSSYALEFSSTGLNISTHTYDLFGKNGVNFVSGIEYNDVTVLTKQNDVRILNGGKTYAEII